MAKRAVEAFGGDDSSVSPGAVTSGKIPKRGVQKDARYPLSDESGSSGGGRVVRAFHDVAKSKTGGLQKDSPRSGAAERQNAVTGEAFHDGGNSSGRVLKAVQPYIVKEFQGRSGQPDNQSINRPKGST